MRRLAAAVALFIATCCGATASAQLAGAIESISAAALHENVLHENAESAAATCDNRPCECLPRTDDVWCISTRCLGCPDTAADPPGFDVWHYDFGDCRWARAPLAEFLAAHDPSTPTVFWCHGNRLYLDESRVQGMCTYRKLTNCVPPDRPIRFVIYSWDTAPIHGLVEDAREKAARTNTEGYYLGWLVNHIDPQVEVNFIGFSFGARVVTGALHLLGGGTLAGRTLTPPPEPRAPMHAVLIAAAMESHWLAVGRKHGQALEVVDSMLSIYNSCDRALKHYGAIDRCYRPSALGYTSVLGPLGANGAKLREVDACCAVGKQHSWVSYFCNPSMVARMRPYVGLAD